MIPSVIPAATIVLMRAPARGAPELLMVERAASLAFAPGALVFPGGRIDPADHALAAASPAPPSDAAARIAAVREMIEEAGIAPGLDLSPPALARIRGGGAMEVAPRWDALVPFARWCPAVGVSRVFDTRFYLTRAPEGAIAAVDGTENRRALWLTAADTLGLANRGDISLLYPTARVLERLATFASFDAAVADARARPETTVTPWTEQRGGDAWLCIPEGLGYPVTAVPLAAARRG